MQPIPNDDPYVTVYREQPEMYEALVAAEDLEGRLLGAIRNALGNLEDMRIAEVGAGTGRVTRQLIGAGARVAASDAAQPMLKIAEGVLQAEYADGAWELQVADARDLPYPGDTFDAAIAGWVLGHFTSWFGETWQAEITRGLDEMRRVVTPGGRLLVIETMGTGTEGPGAPNPELADYYEWMESQGFEREVIATDYGFPSLARAAEVCGAFFGADFAERVRANQWSRVPEWTGLWSMGVE